jgi:hypothetical protein
VREEIVECTAPLRRQPRRPQAAGGRGRRADREAARGDAAMRRRRFEWEGATVENRRRDPAPGAPIGAGGRRRCPIEREVREGADEAVLALPPLRRDRAPAQGLRVEARAGSGGVLPSSRGPCGKRWSSPATPTVPPRRRGPSSGARGGGRASAGQTWGPRGTPVGAAGSTRRAAGPPTPRAC